MEIDKGEQLLFNVNKIEQFLKQCLEVCRKNYTKIQLNPDSMYTIIYTEYMNSLRKWRENHNTSDNPNPFFPKMDFKIKDYKKYHEVIINNISDFIYHSINKKDILLKDFVSYLKDKNIKTNDNYYFFDNLSQIEKKFQMYILDQVTLSTYEHKGSEEVVKAFGQLFQDNPSYKGFSRYRMKDLNHESVINYHKLLTQYISIDEIVRLVNGRIKSFDSNYKYCFIPNQELFSTYMEQLLFNYRAQLLNKVVSSLYENKGREETILCIKNYVETKKPINLLTDETNDGVCRFLLHKYDKPNKIKSVIKQILINNNESVKHLSEEELFDKYLKYLTCDKSKIR